MVVESPTIRAFVVMSTVIPPELTTLKKDITPILS